MAPAANMLGTSRFPIGCMKWQHVVILESIREANSIIKILPAYRTALLTPLLTCSPPLPFSWTNYSKSNSLSPFYSLDKLFKVQLPLFLSPPGQSMLSPISLSFCSSWTENFKSNFNFIKLFEYFFLTENPFFFVTYSLSLLIFFILLPLESKQRPPAPASVLTCADAVDELRF